MFATSLRLLSFGFVAARLERADFEGQAMLDAEVEAVQSVERRTTDATETH
jgi:hypothetical protein